ncbi:MULTISPECIES: murein hydrolase activator EnvC family protein [Carnobacterium]|uniref:murein hydrolase activator EnvC family protein n=1 Tax=Carnobacterium TaxID=2747 RepID=UPI00165B9773|nr:peptidoglycan DD-metalloendopeptidase family protein [Carnobacterium maltaromaticum]MBC9809930.1 peptidoglycan DD-metalloendopeptidase family protein [Carnobacterium maltaromaticum]
MKKILKTIIIGSVSLSSLFYSQVSFAVNYEEEISKSTTEINSIKSEIENEKVALGQLLTEIEKKEDESNQLVEKIKLIQIEMNTLKISNDDLQDKITQRTEKLNSQLQTIQIEGNASTYTNFILNSESFTDFIGRIEVSSKLISANKEIVLQQKEDKEKIVLQENKTSANQKNQKKLISELQEVQVKLENQKNLKEAKILTLAQQQATAEDDKIILISNQENKKIQLEADANKPVIAKTSVDLTNMASASETLEPPAPSLTVGSSGYIYPLQAPISSPFGAREGLDANGFHKGVDFSAPEGTPIAASMAGEVVVAQNDGMPVSGYGIATIIKHSNGMYSLYGHQSELLVSVGDSVQQGQIIGKVGNTGISFGAHLHFEIRTSLYGGMGNVLDPMNFLN